MKADRMKLDISMARSCITTEELALKAEMPLSTVKNVIAGKSVRPATLGKVARALGVDPNCILLFDNTDTISKPRA